MCKKLLFSVLLSLVVILMIGCDTFQSSPTKSEETQNLANLTEEYPFIAWVGISADSINTLGKATLGTGKQKGEQMPLAAGWQVYVSVPFYSQNDPSWSGNPLGFGACGDSKIWRYGCYLCSVCMVYARWGTFVSPPVLNNWQYAGRTHYAFTSDGCGDLIRIPQALQYPGTCRNYQWIGANEIYGQLQRGRPVIIEVWYGSQRHYMVVFGFDGSRFWVKDPWKNAANQDQPLYGTFRSALVWGY